jgi:hypothetical protein
MLHVFNQVIREFGRLRVIALSMGDPGIPIPEVSKITSFTSQLRKAFRNGAAVGEATVQDIIDFIAANAYTLETGLDQGCAISSFVDLERDTPFYVVSISTPRLVSLTALDRGK